MTKIAGAATAPANAVTQIASWVVQIANFHEARRLRPGDDHAAAAVLGGEAMTVGAS
jgi:hypothetical protein